MIWKRKFTAEIIAPSACPKCECIDIYVAYADYQRGTYTCNKCNYCFEHTEAKIDPRVKRQWAAIQSIILEMTEELEDGSTRNR